MPVERYRQIANDLRETNRAIAESIAHMKKTCAKALEVIAQSRELMARLDTEIRNTEVPGLPPERADGGNHHHRN